MRLASTLFFFMSVSTAFPQSRETYQYSRIYKDNNVRSRIMMYDYYRQNYRAVDNFDHNGNLVEHLCYDTSGTKITCRSVVEYGPTGKSLSGAIYNYAHFDTTKKQMIFDSFPDTITIRFEYDSVNSLIRKTQINNKNKIIYEASISFDWLMENEKYYYEDGGFMEGKLNYEVPGIKKSIKAVLHMANGQTKTWDCRFKNSFDKNGRIRRQVLDLNIDFPVTGDPLLYFKDHEYKYMKSGLLISRLSFDPNNHSDYESGEIFDYKFW